MEQEGLSRSVAAFKEQNLTIGKLITDRHRSIAKWVKQVLPSTDHRYDVWHIAKSKVVDVFVNYSCTHYNNAFVQLITCMQV